MSGTAEPERFTWQSLGLDLVGHAWGQADAPVVVLLHGYLDHGRSFAAVAAHLSERYRVLAPDHRGHGLSGHVGAGGYYHFPDYVRDLDALLHALGVSRVALCGHSMGASIAVYFAGAFPDRVSALALIDGVGPPDTPPEQAPTLVRRWINDVRLRSEHAPSGFDDLDAVIARLARSAPHAPTERLRALAPLAARQDANGRWQWRFDPLHRTTGPIPFDIRRFRAFLDAVDCPALAVWGETTPFRPRDADARLARLSDLSSYTIAGAGHNVHIERPDELGAILAGFLARQPLGGPAA